MNRPPNKALHYDVFHVTLLRSFILLMCFMTFLILISFSFILQVSLATLPQSLAQLRAELNADVTIVTADLSNPSLSTSPSSTVYMNALTNAASDQKGTLVSVSTAGLCDRTLITTLSVLCALNTTHLMRLEHISLAPMSAPTLIDTVYFELLGSVSFENQDVVCVRDFTGQLAVWSCSSECVLYGTWSPPSGFDVTACVMLPFTAVAMGIAAMDRDSSGVIWLQMLAGGVQGSASAAFSTSVVLSLPQSTLPIQSRGCLLAAYQNNLVVTLWEWCNGTSPSNRAVRIVPGQLSVLLGRSAGTGLAATAFGGVVSWENQTTSGSTPLSAFLRCADDPFSDGLLCLGLATFEPTLCYLSTSVAFLPVAAGPLPIASSPNVSAVSVVVLPPSANTPSDELSVSLMMGSTISYARSVGYYRSVGRILPNGEEQIVLWAQADP